jgi:hypothetical protein
MHDKDKTQLLEWLGVTQTPMQEPEGQRFESS